MEVSPGSVIECHCGKRSKHEESLFVVLRRRKDGAIEESVLCYPAMQRIFHDRNETRECEVCHDFNAGIQEHYRWRINTPPKIITICVWCRWKSQSAGQMFPIDDLFPEGYIDNILLVAEEKK